MFMSDFLKVRNLVRLIVPLRNVHQVERADSTGTGSSGDSGSILITTAHHTSFLFGNISDRDFLVNKISELLAKLPKLVQLLPTNPNNEYNNTGLCALTAC